jgi:hypothetical protein
MCNPSIDIIHQILNLIINCKINKELHGYWKMGGFVMNENDIMTGMNKCILFKKNGEPFPYKTMPSY